jgi:vanillate O-demethylase monooxygenase subunit
VERYGYVRIWPGDPARANPALLSEFAFLEDQARFKTVRGYLKVEANYQLVVDNLLDLSHVEFLHPMFARKEGVESHRTEFSQEGNTVFAKRLKPNSSLNDFARLFWDSPADRGDGRANMRWDPPSLLNFDLGVTEVGARPEDGVCTPAAHLLTPETTYTTHYFWAQARNRKLGDEALDERLRTAVHNVFVHEDKPMIEAQQIEMGAVTDIIALRPVLLEPDVPTIRARRVLTRMIAEEQGEAAVEAKKTA